MFTFMSTWISVELCVTLFVANNAFLKNIKSSFCIAFAFAFAFAFTF